jgi:hypothetical protein
MGGKLSGDGAALGPCEVVLPTAARRPGMEVCVGVGGVRTPVSILWVPGMWLNTLKSPLGGGNLTGSKGDGPGAVLWLLKAAGAETGGVSAGTMLGKRLKAGTVIVWA